MNVTAIKLFKAMLQLAAKKTDIRGYIRSMHIYRENEYIVFETTNGICGAQLKLTENELADFNIFANDFFCDLVLDRDSLERALSMFKVSESPKIYLNDFLEFCTGSEDQRYRVEILPVEYPNFAKVIDSHKEEKPDYTKIGLAVDVMLPIYKVLDTLKVKHTSLVFQKDNCSMILVETMLKTHRKKNVKLPLKLVAMPFRQD